MQLNQLRVALWGITLCFGGLSATQAVRADNSSTGAATIQAGLANQGQGHFVLDADRLYPSGPQLVGMSGWVDETSFLGPEATLYFEVQTWQLWLHLHPEAAKLAQIPTDRASHETVAAEVEIAFKSGGVVVASQTLVANQDGAFSGPASCGRRNPCGPEFLAEKLIPASLTRQTPPLAIPKDADEMVVTVKALEVPTQRLSGVIVSVTQTFLPKDKLHALVVPLDQAGPGTFRMLDGMTLEATKATEVIFNSNVIEFYAYSGDDTANDGGWVEVCKDPTGAQSAYSESTSVVYSNVYARYRFDDGPWVEDVPAEDTFPDLAQVLMLPILGATSALEDQSGFTLPAAGAGHKRVELAFRLESWMGPRGMIDCEALAGPGYVSEYPNGIWPTVHTTWDSPAGDGSSGWVLDLK